MSDFLEIVSVCIAVVLGILATVTFMLIVTSPFWALGLVALHYVGWI